MSEDLIKRSDAIKDLCDISNNSDMPNDWHRGMSVAISALYRVPSADRPQGEWIYGEHNVAMCDGYRCNRCDFFVPWDYEHKFIDFINDYHYCPNCGAKMKGADDE